MYKLVLASRLCDAGEYERALAYAELLAAGRPPRALLRPLAELADRYRPQQSEETSTPARAPSG